MKIRQQTKKEQREIVFKRLQNLEFKAEFENRIAKSLLSCDKYKFAKSVMVYMTLPNEVSTSLILKDALKQKSLVCVPVTKEEIHLIAIDKRTPFTLGKFNVPEPKKGIEIADVDVAIIPMVAYDRSCNRLGHGKGYFDKFLENKKCYKIGIAFSCQEFEKLSVSVNDIKMDMIITEKEIIYCK
jgi:5-formyltetrahydrofolate cyclo-ligase